MRLPEKAKGGQDGLTWTFELEVVDLGHDEDGDTITSCVAKFVEQH